LPSPSLNPTPGSLSRRGDVAEGLVARAARRGQLVRVSVPDGRVSRAAAEARSDSAMGGKAAAPTSEAEGPNKAPRSRSEGEAERSRRVWASGCVSPTGARRDRSGDRPDRAEGGKRGQRSGIGAIPYREGVAVLLECSPPARRRRARALTGGTEERSRSEGTTVSDRGRGRRPRAAGGHGHGRYNPRNSRVATRPASTNSSKRCHSAHLAPPTCGRITWVADLS